MENETVCGGCIGADYGGRHVPALAGEVEDRSVVSEYGDAGPHRLVLRHGHFPGDIVCSDILCGAAGIVAVSESV